MTAAQKALATAKAALKGSRKSNNPDPAEPDEKPKLPVDSQR